MKEFLFIDTADMEWEEPFEGVRRKVITGENLTFCLYHLKAGLTFPPHQHLQEQMAYIVEGKVEFSMGEGEKHIFREGMFFSFGPNVRHGARFLEDSIVLDVFSPPMDYPAVRPEYVEGGDV
jgi:quercetin dioxygenase-like cupin family protein